MDADRLRKLIEAMSQRIFDHADELTALDQAIGDGDHGLNMKRGFAAVLRDVDPAASSLSDTLRSIGMTLVMTVGGASGPLYGTLFMTLGKELPAAPSRDDVVRAGEAAIAAVKARGKSEIGQKTMLDVLEPALRALAAGQDVVQAADRAAEATVPMQAMRGRASFLGERSIGHMDPGARSSALLIAAASEALGRL